MIASVVAALVITLVVALARPVVPAPSSAGHTPPSSTERVPTPSPSAVQGLAIRAHISQQLNLGDQVANALAVSPGVVWVATQGVLYGDAGRLIRITTLPIVRRRVGSWEANQLQCPAAGGYVWVANSSGDGSKVLPDQNTVMQLDANTGALVHIYRVNDPRGLVANGNSASGLVQQRRRRGRLNDDSGVDRRPVVEGGHRSRESLRSFGVQ